MSGPRRHEDDEDAGDEEAADVESGAARAPEDDVQRESASADEEPENRRGWDYDPEC